MLVIVMVVVGGECGGGECGGGGLCCLCFGQC